jgi:hypothetical protein
LNVFQTIKGTEFEIYYANFVEPPVNSNRTHYTCTVTGTPLQFQLFKGKLDNFGYIYVIATEAALDKEKPRAMQVYWGYNSKNVLQPRGWTIVTEKFKDSDVTISKH